MLVLKAQAPMMLEVLAMAVQPWPKEIVIGTSGSIEVFGLRMVAEVLATAAVMENWLGTSGGCFGPVAATVVVAPAAVLAVLLDRHV